jgi:hypothetical protein
MLRRLCTVLIVLACAFAPALPALETADKSDGCGCGKACCGTNDCAPPPATPRATTTLNVVGAVEARATLACPARSAATRRPFSVFQSASTQPTRALRALRVVAVVASAPLYQVHCAFLI